MMFDQLTFRSNDGKIVFFCDFRLVLDGEKDGQPQNDGDGDATSYQENFFLQTCSSPGSGRGDEG